MTRTKPLILSTALTGVRFSPWRKDQEGNSLPINEAFKATRMPVTPEEIETAARSSYRNGARFIHVHARNPVTGEQFASLPYYKDITRRIRENCPGAIISYPTSRKGEVEKQINAAQQDMENSQSAPLSRSQRADIEARVRPIGIEAKPDTITSFTVPEMKMFGTPKDTMGIEDVPGWNDPEVMKMYYKNVLRRAKELGVHQEIEVQTLGQFDIMRKLYDFGGMNEPIHLVLLPGFSAGFPITRQAYETALQKVDEFRAYTGLPVTVTCGAVILPRESKTSPYSGERGKHDYREVFEWVAEDDRVDLFRTGVEDSPMLYGRQMTNEELVNHAVQLCREHGIAIETDPDKVRKKFGFNESGLSFWFNHPKAAVSALRRSLFHRADDQVKLSSPTLA